MSCKRVNCLPSISGKNGSSCHTPCVGSNQPPVSRYRSYRVPQRSAERDPCRANASIACLPYPGKTDRLATRLASVRTSRRSRDIDHIEFRNVVRNGIHVVQTRQLLAFHIREKRIVLPHALRRFEPAAGLAISIISSSAT